jgi:hypothetical protein
MADFISGFHSGSVLKWTLFLGENTVDVGLIAGLLAILN